MDNRIPVDEILTWPLAFLPRVITIKTLDMNSKTAVFIWSFISVETLTTFSRKSVYLAYEFNIPDLISDVISYKFASANKNPEDLLLNQSTRKVKFAEPTLKPGLSPYSNVPGIQCVKLFSYFESFSGAQIEEFRSHFPANTNSLQSSFSL